MSRKQWGHGFYRGLAAGQAIDQKSLIGMWFHSRSNDGEIQWQGRVERRIEDGTFYIVQLYSFLDGSPTIQKVMAFSRMKDWTFYPDDQAMRYQYYKESGMTVDEIERVEKVNRLLIESRR